MERVVKLSIDEIKNVLVHQWEMQTRGNFSFPLVLNNIDFYDLQEILAPIKNLGLSIETWDLEEMLATEFSGIPYLTDDKHTDYQSIFPQEDTVLLLENFSGFTDKDIKSSLHTIISERKINGHDIPDNILLILKGEIDEFQLEKLLDPATLDRLRIVSLGEQDEKTN